MTIDTTYGCTQAKSFPIESEIFVYKFNEKSDLIRSFSEFSAENLIVDKREFDDNREDKSSDWPLKILKSNSSSSIFESNYFLKNWTEKIGSPTKVFTASQKNLTIRIDNKTCFVVGEVASVEICDKVAIFTYYLRTLESIENFIEKSWESLRTDVQLTHRVQPVQLRNWHHVNTMTDISAQARITLERLGPAMDKLISKTSKNDFPGMEKIMHTLLAQSNFEDRMEWASDKLEVYEDTYELANDRLSEFSYFNFEAKLEIWIIVILLLELFFLAIEVFT